MRLKTKVAYNTIIQIISKAVAIILGLLAVAMITRGLGQQGFGEYTTIITYLSFFGIIADLGLTLVTIQFISRPGEDQEKALGNLLGLRLVSAVIFLGLAPLSVVFFPYSAEVKTGVAVASLSFLFVALNQILVGLFQKNLRMDKVSIAEVANRVVLLLGVYLTVRFEWGLPGILWATVASSLASFAIHYGYSRRFARITLRFDFDYWKGIIALSWPLAITIALNLIYLKSDTLLLSLIPRHSDIGIIAEVGIYGAAYKVIDVLITVPFMFAGIILPILTRAWIEGNKESFNDILQKSFDAMVIFSLPMAAGTLFIADSMMTIVAGKDFSASGPILRLLIFAALAIFLGNMYAHAVIALNKQKNIIKAYIFVAITSLAGYLVFIPFFSYRGAAWVTIYSESAIALASYYIVWKYSRFVPSFVVFAKSILACLFMSLLIYFFRLNFSRDIIQTVAVGVAGYGLAIYALRVVTKEDIADLLNR